MKLTIETTGNKIDLRGSLLKNDSLTLKRHIKGLINRAGEKLILNLQSLDTMDYSAVTVLESLHLYAIKKNKKFHIIGKENDKIKNVVKRTRLDFIVLREEFAKLL